MSEPMQRANRWILAAMFGLAWVGIASAQTYWLQPAIPGTSRYLPPAGTPQNPLYFYRDGYPLGQFSRPGLNQPLQFIPTFPSRDRGAPHYDFDEEE